MKDKIQGVLCGTDRHQEWLLPWWWSRYTDYNAFDVAFCDFGMSKEGRAWCEKRGKVIDIVWDKNWNVSESDVLLEEKPEWEKNYGKHLSRLRQAWFKKPVALLSTPFQKTIWVDLDCEILAPLSFLFDLCDRDDFFGILREPADSHLPRFDPEIQYNSGVIIYTENREKIKKWAAESITSNEKFWGDDVLLSHLISVHRWEVDEIPEVWNWKTFYGVNLNVKIAHWAGAVGKKFIRKTGGLKPYLDRFYTGSPPELTSEEEEMHLASSRKKAQGVLCGADLHQEWLLPWWWSRYRDHNLFDVAFCDFGMSKEARAWCEERAEVVDIVWDKDWIVPEDKSSLQNRAIWKQYYAEELSHARQAWFKKPLALLSTPFQKTIWIDLDCEILASLSFLFDLCDRDDFLGILREPVDSHLPLFDPQIRYNSGVIIYSQDLSKLEKWAKEAIVSNEKFWSDDVLLSHLISVHRWEVDEIPEIWNWKTFYGVNLNVKIAHWMGAVGKKFIRKTGGLKPYLDRFYTRSS